MAFALLALALPAWAQEGVVFAPKKDPMLETIKAGLGRKPSEGGKRTMWVDFSKVDAPRDLSEFRVLWHTPPVRQGLSDMCWCFSTTSFLESEISRLSGRELRLSSLHTVYWEQYGAVPAAAYTGLTGGRTEHDQDPALYSSHHACLEGVTTSTCP